MLCRGFLNWSTLLTIPCLMCNLKSKLYIMVNPFLIILFIVCNILLPIVLFTMWNYPNKYKTNYIHKGNAAEIF